MARDELGQSLHRYLDGELETAGRLRVEERLRNDPAFRAEYESMRALDEQLSRAIVAERAELARAEAAASGAVSVAQGTGASGSPVRMTPSFWRRPGWGVAAAIVIMAIAIYASARTLRPRQENDPSIDGYIAQIALLRADNQRLRQRRGLLDLAPTFQGPGVPESLGPTAGTGVAGAATAESAAPTGPVVVKDKNEVFSSIRDLLNEFGRTQKWDEARGWELLRQLHSMKDLSIEDFRELESLFRQQGPDTMGRLFLAHALGRNFMHLPQAREFVFSQIDLAMQDLRATGGQSDRVLRRAWTDTLANMKGDPRSVGYLREIGQLDRDWLNRRNVLGNLATIGSAESLTALAAIARGEKQGYLKYEGLLYVRDMIATDPSLLGRTDTATLTLSLIDIVQGGFGEAGSYWDAMVLALDLLNQLGFVDSARLRNQWQNRNLLEAGGDPRGGNPLGLPGGDRP